ncbi:MAG: hypothetical protein GY810_19925 [Aureispira sp.]|nr:hypothetical protein [Aureispira sp.]
MEVKKNWTERLRERLTEYVDKRFEDYRGQIALDLSRGLAGLAGLVAIWTIGIICSVFVGIALALFLAWGLSFWIGQFAYIVSFFTIAIVFLGIAYFIIQHKEKYIEDPVFKIMSKTLRSPEFWGLEDKNEVKEATDKELIKMDEPQTAENDNDQSTTDEPIDPNLQS